MFSWKPFVQEFATKILEFKDNRNELINTISVAIKELGEKAPNFTFDRDINGAEVKNVGELSDIDPFTILSLLINAGSKKRDNVADDFKRVFKIEASTPTDYDGVPVMPDNGNKVFSLFSESSNSIMNRTKSINILWRLFASVLLYSSDRDDSAIERDFNQFKWDGIGSSSEIKMMRTAPLFWLRPDCFLCLDKNLIWYIEKQHLINNYSPPQSWKEYILLCEQVSNNLPAGDSLMDLSYAAYRAATERISKAYKKLYDDFWDRDKDIRVKKKSSDSAADYLQKLLEDFGQEEKLKYDEYNAEEVNAILSFLYERIEKDDIKKGYIKYIEQWISFLESSKADGIVGHEKEKEQLYDKDKSIILYGPPGTGKTRLAKISAARIVGEKHNLAEDKALEEAKKIIDASKRKNQQIKLVQMHPSYSYYDFMEAIELKDGVFKPVDKVFKDFANQARNNPKKKYVLIIDEINRANVADVFGELLYALEYRETEITTSLREEGFVVPDNLYIIGTMNTADRSLQNLDYALRRRFTFRPVYSKEIKGISGNKVFCAKAYGIVQEDVKKSCARGIAAEDIMPGGSYFIVNKAESEADGGHFEYKMKYELIPLLREYAKDGLFTDRQKINGEKSLMQMIKTDDYYDRIYGAQFPNSGDLTEESK